jgi:hypothetical protein
MATKLDTGISAGHRGLEGMAAPQLVIDTRRRGPLSPEELASAAQKVREKRNPASGRGSRLGHYWRDSGRGN